MITNKNGKKSSNQTQSNGSNNNNKGAANDRELIKYFKSDNLEESKKVTLDEIGGQNEPFDQFANKNSTYDFNKYTTQIDKKTISPEKKARAKKLEAEIE